MIGVEDGQWMSIIVHTVSMMGRGLLVAMDEQVLSLEMDSLVEVCYIFLFVWISMLVVPFWIKGNNSIQLCKYVSKYTQKCGHKKHEQFHCVKRVQTSME